MSAPLHKPPRVEKWQRWRDSRGVMFTAIEDTGNGDKWILRKDGDNGHWLGNDMLARDGWTFLGYAKPDKVEVGQRWRDTSGVERVVHEVFGDAANIRSEHGSYGIQKAHLLTGQGWEYLGMAESATPPAEDGLRPRFAPGETRVAIMSEPTVEQANAYAPTDTPLANAFRAYVPDPKAEARRANEEAAKRLIANPPEWAYPKAWMCAVLALQERANVDAHRIFPTSGDKICAEMLTEECERAHKRQARISGVVYDPIRDVMYDAYARGMERPSPMTRQGVKGGISTCDLGVDYE